MADRQLSAEELRLLDLLYGELEGEAEASALREVEADAGKLLRFSGEGAGIGLFNDLEEHADVILLGGVPLGEPLVFQGSFVMDSVAAIRRAEQDYGAGRMGALAG